MPETKRGVGRPRTRPDDESPGGDYVGFRASRKLKRRLSEVAAGASRSLSAETEFRLEHSFDRQDLLGEVLELRFRVPLAGLLMAIGIAMDESSRAAVLLSQLGKRDRQSWADDPFAYDQAIRAANSVLEAFRPKGDPSRPEKFPNSERMGENVAQDTLGNIHPNASIFPDLNPRDAETAKMRRSLGAEMLKRLPTAVLSEEKKK